MVAAPVYSLKIRLAVAAGSLVAGVIVGIATAYYAFSVAGVAPASGQTGWVQRSLEPGSKVLPYVMGHYLAAGQLPPPRSIMDFTRTASSDGSALRGDCLVTLEGVIPQARWWTLSAVTKDGIALGPRAVLSAATAILESDEQIIVHVATEPQPGNWIAPQSGGTYALALTLHDPVLPMAQDVAFPDVKRDGC